MTVVRGVVIPRSWGSRPGLRELIPAIFGAAAEAGLPAEFTEDSKSVGRSAVLVAAEDLSSTPAPEGSIIRIVVATSVSSSQRERWVAKGIVDWILIGSSQADILAIFRRISRRMDRPEFEILDIVTALSGVVWTDDKLDRVETRLTRRLIQLKVPRNTGNPLATYLEYFRKNRSSEMNELLSLLTTHTTEFFRDTPQFDYLVSTHLREKISRGQKIRIWSAACSTGEETYSIAMAIWDEARRLRAPVPKLEIFGTDIDDRSVKQAAKGIFHQDSVAQIHPAIRQEYLQQGLGDLASWYRIRDDLWKQCRFFKTNLLDGVIPEGKFDAIFVRNVFIYFEKSDISRVVRSMQSSLAPGGLIYVGASETLDRTSTGLFAKVDGIYASQSESGEIRSVARPESSLSQPTRVLVVDDSKLIRVMLRKILTAEHGFEVVGEAKDPIDAAEFLKAREVDVVSLDIHMPRMDGVSYLKSIQGSDHPPVVVISSISEREARDVFFCLDLGASDFVQKPNGMDLIREAEIIRQSIRAASCVGRHLFGPGKKQKPKSAPKVTAPLAGSGHMSLIEYSPPPERLFSSEYVLIGASTGGIEAIRAMISQFPKICPPVVIIQHIPPVFSRLFAERLNDVSRVPVKEAAHGMVLEPNAIYVAPGGFQLGLVRKGERVAVEVLDQAHYSLHRPSIDFAFEAFLKVINPRRDRISAALLTGMGKDGAKALLDLRNAGHHTIAQDEASCVVYGMPKAAVDIGAAVEELPLERISSHLFHALMRGREKFKEVG